LIGLSCCPVLTSRHVTIHECSIRRLPISKVEAFLILIAVNRTSKIDHRSPFVEDLSLLHTEYIPGMWRLICRACLYALEQPPMLRKKDGPTLLGRTCSSSRNYRIYRGSTHRKLVLFNGLEQYAPNFSNIRRPPLSAASRGQQQQPENTFNSFPSNPKHSSFSFSSL